MTPTVSNGKLCAYCGNKTILRKTEYGWQYACVPCGAHVGCHKGTSTALGRVANAELRFWKSEAHAWFDPIWQSGKMTRTKAYLWLADQLRIDGEDCHIGMMDVAMCKWIVQLCKNFYNIKL